MLAKSGQNLVRALALVFTTVVAPIAVNVVVHDLNGEESAPARTEPASPQKQESPVSHERPSIVPPAFAPSGQSASSKQPTAVTIQPDALIHEVVQSTGHTPDEALQQALRIGLYKAIVAEFGADSWTRKGSAVFEDAWRNKGGIVRSWKTLAVTKEWKDGEERYHADVTIDLDRRALGRSVSAVH
jgi:hypothetical protein